MYFGLLGFGLLFGLFAFVVALVVQVLYLLNLMRLLEAVHPMNREMSPGLVWLNLIPVFEIGWMIYTVVKIKNSVGKENASRWGASVNEGNTHTVGLVYSILAAVAFVFSYGGYASRALSVLGGLLSIAVLVTWIMYWVKTHRIRVELEQSARGGYGQPQPYGPGGQPGPYGSGGQYGAGGPYAPSGPYAPGAPGYAQPGPGYGPAAGADPAAAPQAAPGAPTQAPDSAPPQPSAPAGGPSCALCGNRLAPGDQFCSVCGTAVPKG